MEQCAGTAYIETYFAFYQWQGDVERAKSPMEKNSGAPVSTLKDRKATQDIPPFQLTPLFAAFEQAITIFADEMVAFGVFQVGLHHFADECIEADARLPSQFIVGTGSVAQ